MLLLEELEQLVNEPIEEKDLMRKVSQDLGDFLNEFEPALADDCKPAEPQESEAAKQDEEDECVCDAKTANSRPQAKALDKITGLSILIRSRDVPSRFKQHLVLFAEHLRAGAPHFLDLFFGIDV